MTPKFDIIVTRHPFLIAVLIERGLIDESTPVLTHVSDPEQIRGKNVIGVLPHHLSARAASITEIPMRWSEADRAAMQRGDVGLDGTREAAGDPVTYWVAKADFTVAIGRAVSQAVAAATVYSGHHWTRAIQDEHHDAPRIVFGGACEQIAAEVDLWRAWWRPIDGSGIGAWRDAWGTERALYRLSPSTHGGRLHESVDAAERTAKMAGLVNPAIDLVEPSWADPRKAAE